jgi:branched-subunit amino acid ABC-type transport system permease component
VLSFSLLSNAIVSGLLLGGFYAGVAAGATISFGLLDIANIAHPTFVVFGAYCAFALNQRFHLDPLLAAVFVTTVFMPWVGSPISCIITPSSGAAMIPCAASLSSSDSCSSAKSSLS